ncbi:His-Xaa-Ser system protein HxsD [Pseudenhygromyxa sp. WMMC2535]|uniref:His-Xaa-Ser system protein HxsD n=1 Tax=Pseudenhygromyxa sp. WMMC2535 TaxID=2712867 RepID=UPI001555BD49|nr:His-Xaa-Ser system protein HxsD [Pseudenhygromyxa sp. WMMC2535]NVB36983.1 His-Xaa-Ser system protein HxsD [Pseudenhygromyxa sp. WMMC2535]
MSDENQTSVPDIPEALVGVDLGEQSVSMTLDAELYPLQAVYGAAYIFIDRCYVFIDRPEAGRFRVTLSAKQGVEEIAALRALIGEFANELLSCAWRHQITQDNRVAIETVTVQAIAGAMGEPSLDDLADFDFTDEALDDPLGIAQSWEEKHGRKDPAEGAESQGGSA